MAENKNELSTINELETKLMEEENLDEINKIVEMFNVNLQKKNIIRSAKLSDVQDKVVQQMTDRFEQRADSFSNDDLIKYHKIIFSGRIDELTMSEASKIIDKIIYTYGRIL